MKNFIQIESINSEDFKNEIIRGVIEQIKGLSFNNQNEENPTELLSRDATAKLLSMSLVTLWKLTKEKIIPSYKIGRKVLYKREEVLASIIKRTKSTD